jgi:hypothetical protein
MTSPEKELIMTESNSPQEPMAIPKWDVALEAMAKEEYTKLGRPLRLEDYRRLAQQYTIRLDDIMVTIFELCIQGSWQYQDAYGKPQKITRQLLTRLTAAGRLDDEDLKTFTGGWEPVD